MRMLVAPVNFELGQKHTSKAILGNHSFDCVMNQFFRLMRTNLLNRTVFFAAFPAGVGHELLIRLFFAGHTDLFRIDNDNKVASIKVGRINGFVLAAQNVGNLYGQSAQNRAVSINK